MFSCFEPLLNSENKVTGLRLQHYVNSSEILDKLKARDFNTTVCLLMSFRLFTLLYPLTIW